MAKRRTTTRAMTVHRAPAGASPIIRIAAPTPVKATKRHGGKRRGGGGGGGIMGGGMVEMAVAAGVVGLAEKEGVLSFIPSIPLLGKKGTAAIALKLLLPHNRYAQKAALVLAIVSAYQFGKSGSIDGDE